MSSYDQVIDMYRKKFQGNVRKTRILLKACDVIDNGGDRLDKLERLLADVDDVGIVRANSFRMDPAIQAMIDRMSD